MVGKPAAGAGAVGGLRFINAAVGRLGLLLQLLLPLQLLLLPRLDCLLLLSFVVRIAERALEALLLLRLRLERLPDDVGLRLFGGREHAEDGLAAIPVDADPSDSGRRDERHLRLVLERDQRPLLPDRGRNPSALSPAAERPRRVVAEIDAGNDVRRTADEPDVGRAVGRAGLAEQRTVEIAEHGRCAALDDPFHDVNDLERGHGIDQLLGAAGRTRHRLPSQSGALQLPMTAQRLSVR